MKETLSLSRPSATPAKTGVELLHDPALNKGTAFTREEREKLGLVGLLPPRVTTMEEQAARVMKNLRRRGTDIEKYVDMMSLMDRNQTLFYRVVLDNLPELLPVIYTPTVGQGCQEYSHLFRRSRGVFLTRLERGSFADVLRRWPQRDVRVIVVTDGERILGLGDLGVNGMGIPVGKLSLYTACAGVPPEATLPIALDVGTNNEALLADPLYLGMKERRLEGAAYDDLLEEFMGAVAEVFPAALVQFEDFANRHAFALLERFRGKACCFNDDIQGTAAVTLAGLLSSGRLTGRRLSEERLLFHGAGEAAIGIGELVVSAMMEEGLPKKEAMARCWFMDSKGLVEAGRRDLQPHKKPFAHPAEPAGDLLTAVKRLAPTALIGVSGKAAQFTQPIVEEMARINAKPIVFALSNPTSNSECTAEQAYRWSKGRAIFASGSPFPPLSVEGRARIPGQANNAYVFPGIGLGIVVSKARRVTDEMFLKAARTLAGFATRQELEAGCLFPSFERIRDVSARVAAATAEAAFDRGLADSPRPKDVLEEVRRWQYAPEYPSYA